MNRKIIYRPDFSKYTGEISVGDTVHYRVDHHGGGEFGEAEDLAAKKGFGADKMGSMLKDMKRHQVDNEPGVYILTVSGIGFATHNKSGSFEEGTEGFCPDTGRDATFLPPVFDELETWFYAKEYRGRRFYPENVIAKIYR